MFDRDAFEERSAIMEFDGGLSRFQAETLAAQAQGFTRWEMMNEIRQRDSEQARHHRQADDRDNADNLPGVQPHAAEQNRQVPVRDVQAGRRGGSLLALRLEHGGVSR